MSAILQTITIEVPYLSAGIMIRGQLPSDHAIECHSFLHECMSMILEQAEELVQSVIGAEGLK